jgi:hypothetical protein
LQDNLARSPALCWFSTRAGSRYSERYLAPGESCSKAAVQTIMFSLEISPLDDSDENAIGSVASNSAMGYFTVVSW